MIKLFGKVTSVTVLTVTLSLATGGAAFGATSAPSGSSAHASRDKTLTGYEIWRIVQPHHRIVCSRATRELKKIARADAAAGTRLARAQARLGQLQGTKASAAMVRRRTGSVKGFEKLRNDGTALIAKIDTKCKITTPTT